MAGLKKRWNYMPESAHLISCEHKGECKLEKQGEYERRVEAVVEQCDNQIEQFKADLEEAGPEQREKYDEEIRRFDSEPRGGAEGLVTCDP